MTWTRIVKTLLKPKHNNYSLTVRSYFLYSRARSSSSKRLYSDSPFCDFNFLDLHCSSEDDEADDDMMEEVKGEYNDLTMPDDGQTQVAAAEAMMQLGSFPCFSGLSSGK